MRTFPRSPGAIWAIGVISGLLAVSVTTAFVTSPSLAHVGLGFGFRFGVSASTFTDGHGGTFRATPSTLKSTAEQQQEVTSEFSLNDDATSDGNNVSVDGANNHKEKKTEVLADDEEFLKPELDKRKYRSILLPNNLQVLLVSDPLTDIESAAVHAKAGHMDDPDHRAGLAHFHEHMLFLGTEKYPDENDFEEYLGKNGGTSNAYTDMQDTNYYLNVAPLEYDDDDEYDSENDQHDDATDLSTNAIHANEATKGKVSTALAGALDRFAQFFISPLFNVNSVERELRAINSEYLNAMTSDSWRNYLLLKSSCLPSHPFSKFGCGNYNTLTNGGDINGSGAAQSGGSSPRDDLIQFWEKHYVAENIKLCVVARADLDELQKTVEETFADVRSRGSAHHSNNVVPSPTDNYALVGDHADVNGVNGMFQKEHARYKIKAFGPEQLGVVREVIPLVEMRSIKVYFATPPMDDDVLKETRPYRVLSHLLGHESPGSLHALLLEEGLINDLSSGVAVDTDDFSMCSIGLSLTPKGMAQRDHVLSLVWQWINLIKRAVENDNDGLIERYHDELRQVSKNSFKFRENGDPTDFCSGAAEMLFDYESEKILVGSSMPGPYNATVAKEFLKRFTPDNSMVTVYDPDLEDDSKCVASEFSASQSPWQTEKWYKAKYRQITLPPAVKEKWINNYDRDPRLQLPKLNEFIPSDFSLRSEDVDAVAATDPDIDYSKENPKLLIDKPGLRMWHKMDRTFKVPKTALRLYLTSPNVYRSPRTMTLNRLFQKVLNDDLNSFVYDAILAGCNYRVVCVPEGYVVSVTGYSEKLPNLLDVVTSRMLSLIEEMKEGEKARPGLANKFAKAKENLLRETKNFRLESPYETASYVSRMMLEDNVWHVRNYIAEMEGEFAEKDPLTMEECAKIAEECLTKRLSVEFACMGNINEEGAHNVVKLINDHFLHKARPLEYEEIPRLRSLKMPNKQEAVRIFGPGVKDAKIPLVLEEVTYSESEENHAVQVILQVGSEHEMGYEGVAVLELIGHMAYNSAYNQLRTKEQLGYIVSAFTKKSAGGAQSFGVLVQSSTTLPAELEKRCEAWLEMFREELEQMPAERIALEAAGVVAQLLERNMRFRDEVSSSWAEIVSSGSLGSKHDKPAFDRLEKLAKILTVSGSKGKEMGTPLADQSNPDASDGNIAASPSRKTAEELKQLMLEMWDKYFVADAPERRAISTRVYGHKGKEVYEQNVGKPGVLSNYDDIRQLKKFFSLWPSAPYWI